MQVQAWAAVSLANTTLQHPANQTRLAEVGGVAALLRLLERSKPSAPSARQQSGRWACRRRAAPGAPAEAPTRDEIPLCAVQEAVAKAISSAAFNHPANQRLLVEGGCIQLLAAQLRWGPGPAQLEAARTLCNVMCTEGSRELFMAEEGVLPVLVELMRSEVISLREVPATIIGNLASDHANRSKLAEAGCVAPLIEQVKKGSAQGKKWATMALVALMEGSHSIKTQVAEAGAVPALVAMGKSGEPQAVVMASKAMGALTSGHTGNQELVRRNGAAAALERLAQMGGLKITSLTAEQAEELRGDAAGSDPTAGKGKGYDPAAGKAEEEASAT